MDVENIYNGGGVGIADFNNDGLQDIYFTGNRVANRLYLNKGNFKFEDITQQAGVNGQGRWCRGVSIIDINNDGLMDMYVSASLLPDSHKRENLLYINKGINEQGIPNFENRSREYNLADTSHSTMAAFFDYDNDGDLDMYLLVNEIVKKNYPNTFRPILNAGQHPSTDKLFRNDWNDSLQHPVFTNVSKQAGITIEGYGHGVNICDINNDGWKDIYVANDFISNNMLYINNKNGTFTDRVQTYFKHTSENSMGVDVADINNDGLPDIIELDMNPEDNYRKKMMLNQIGYLRYVYNAKYGYQHQYVRNVLQLNRGPRLYENDSLGEPVFSDISFYAGIAETDWSWAPLVTDFDNDGYRDIIITNGFPKDVTDHDFIAYRNKTSMLASKRQLLDQIPDVKIANYAFKNNGNLTFKNTTDHWGLSTPSFSNGAAYADLDNDGDMDFVVNNINDKAFLYRNNERQLFKNNYLQVQFTGGSLNKNGIGAWIELHYDSGKLQVYENTPYHGYLSSTQYGAHFGLGKTMRIDSVVIKWPTGKAQIIKNVNANQVLKVDSKNAGISYDNKLAAFSTPSLFREITSSVNINYIHHDSDFVDFNIQKLLPHKFSEYGPALAVADVDGNGLDDIVCGASLHDNTRLFLQQPKGTFIEKEVDADAAKKNSEDAGILLFDADNDTDPDLYIASGSNEATANSSAYQDRLYINDGKGNFRLSASSLPVNFASKSCVRAADIDKDGDLDLFIAGRVEPGKYPKPVSSFILRNDTKNETILFTDISDKMAPALNKIGLVCDAVFTDFDNDGWPDLILAGEWMPVTLLKNNKGAFENITDHSAIANQKGWWTSIAPGDFDNDGDIDYIVGNLGLNSFYRGSEKYPVQIYAGDFDNNNGFDAVPTLFLKPTSSDTVRKEFTAHQREDILSEINSFRKKYYNYNVFAKSPVTEMFSKQMLQNAIRLEANNFANSIIINRGMGRFSIHALPWQAQFACLNGMVVQDVDGDGNLDMIASGNDFGAEVFNGRQDAMNGLFLKGNGDGSFQCLSILHSGIFIPGNGKALVQLQSASGKYLLAASQNKGTLKIFELNKTMSAIRFNTMDVKCSIQYKNGKILNTQVNYGSSFLSQSARFLSIDSNVVSVTIYDYRGAVRKINL